MYDIAWYIMVLDDSHNRYNVNLNILPPNLKKLPADGFAKAHTLSMQANKSQFLVAGRIICLVLYL